MRAHRRTSDGALLAEGIATREGVLEYARADGSIRRELVTREAVLDTARTLPRSSLTLGHPKSGFVTPDNVGQLQVGDVDGRADIEEDAQGAFVRVRVAARRKDALAAIDAGTHEVSAGYDVTLDETPGTHPVHGRYDARQIGRECNHLALVPRGRAGRTVALRVDADDAEQVPPPAPATPTPPARAGSREVSMKPGLIALLAALGVARFDSEEAALEAALPIAKKALEDQADAARLRKDAEDLPGVQSKLEEAEKKAKDLETENEGLKRDEAARKDAAELGRLQAVATKAGVKHDGLDLPKLRLALAKSRVDSLTDKSPAAVVDGVLMTIENDQAKRKTDAQDPRWKFDRVDEADDKGKGGSDKEQRKDEFYNPWLSQADEARVGGGK